MIFTPAAWERLRTVGSVRSLDDSTMRDDLIGALGDGDVDVLVTSWGAVPLDSRVLDHAPALRLVAHSASSVKSFLTSDVFARGIRVTQAGQAMAAPVAEVALTFTLSLLHRVHRFDHALRRGDPWNEAQEAPVRHELAASRIGVVGASRTGVAYIRMLRALGADVVVYDPFLSADAARELGVRRMDLDPLLRGSQVVALHAPSLPETRHMIGARELALMPDGAGLVNTARSWLVDEAALLTELTSGRLDAALDVFDDEPLPVDSPLRRLANVLLTPHQAAGTIESRQRLGDIVVDEIERFAQGRPLEHEVDAAALTRMA
ncbi:hydroxyacid dehydrogenase [Micromonospora sp. NPDC048830]|uniref:hydroxyacid dehydrogenase n=1 Tax=Micromonospora sp. NPDC048830 TaxID=3364257 RepID=UPI00371FCD18